MDWSFLGEGLRDMDEAQQGTHESLDGVHVVMWLVWRVVGRPDTGISPIVIPAALPQV